MAGIAKNSSAILLVVCGAINALLSKTVYQLQAPDCSGTVKPFEKPWLQTALMFLAMALCLPISWVQTRWQQRRKRRSSKPHHRQQQHTRQHGRGDAPPAGSAGEGGDGDVESQQDGQQQQQTSPTAATAAIKKAAAISTLLAAAGTAASAHDPTHTSTRALVNHAARAGDQNHPGPENDSDLHQPLLQSHRQEAAALHTRRQQQQQQHGEGDDGRHGSSSSSSRGRRDQSGFRQALLLCVPTGFDLAATTLMNVGLLYVAASVFQILRGAEMIFAALFAVVFLHRPLNRWHYSGVALCMVGIGCVGASRMLAGDSSGGEAAAAVAEAAGSGSGTTPRSMLGVLSVGDGGGGGGGDPKKAALGMGLILLSQAIQAGQVTVEDHLMSDLAMQPLLVVGWEGLIGSLVMFGGALPLLQALTGRYSDGSGFAEDTRGSWCMARQSGAIAGALGVSTFAVLLYNIFGMYVTDSVGAAARVVLENARTLLVWLAALALFYTHVGGGTIGEPWDQWSWLQAVGFAIFATGAYLYNRGHKQQEEQEAAEGKAPAYSKWAVLKSTLGISTGHRVAWRRFRVAGAAVLAGVRARRAANGLGGNRSDDDGSGSGSESL